MLKGESTLGPLLPQAFTIAGSLPHGHVAAVLAAIERLGLPRLLQRKPCRQRYLVLAMIAARILEAPLGFQQAVDPLLDFLKQIALERLFLARLQQPFLLV